MKKIRFNNSSIFSQHIRFHTTENDGTPESIYWDYKARYSFENKEEFAKDICAFANTFGGSILIGVLENKNVANLKVASGLLSVQDAERIKSDIYNGVLPLIAPSPSVFVDVFSIEAQTIISVNIDPLVNSIACVKKIDRVHFFCYPYRSDFGKQYYTPLEVEKIMSSSSYRAAEIFFRENVNEQTDILLISPVFQKPQNGNMFLINLEAVFHMEHLYDWGFDLKYRNMRCNVPFSAIKRIWKNLSEKIELELELFIVVSIEGYGTIKLISSTVISENSKFIIN